MFLKPVLSRTADTPFRGKCLFISIVLASALDIGVFLAYIVSTDAELSNPTTFNITQQRCAIR